MTVICRSHVREYLDRFVSEKLPVPFKNFSDFEIWCNNEVKIPFVKSLACFFVEEIEKIRAEEREKFTQGQRMFFEDEVKEMIKKARTDEYNKVIKNICGAWDRAVIKAKKTKK